MHINGCKESQLSSKPQEVNWGLEKASIPKYRDELKIDLPSERLKTNCSNQGIPVSFKVTCLYPKCLLETKLSPL